jgi:hypothetical protein
MKTEQTTTQSYLARRSWLGAVAAGIAGLPALRWLGRRERPAAPPSFGRSTQQKNPTANVVKLSVRPSADSVKRHG